MVSNSQQCEDLIKSINHDVETNEEFLKDAHQKYQQQDKYIEIINYAVKSNELYHLYDIWQVYVSGRKQTTRGFFLDLWDIYEEEESKLPDSDSYQREKEILRYCIAQAYNQFDEILNVEAITAPERWRAYIQELSLNLMWVKDEKKCQLKRKLLYSMSHLYVCLYHVESPFAKEEKESLIKQLIIAQKAKICQVEESNFSIDLKNIFTTTQNSDLQKQFTFCFLYLYRFTRHFDSINLKDFVEQIVDSLQTEEFIQQVGSDTAVELLSQILRYWGATSPLINLFLQEKLNFQFYKYQKSENIDLPTPYGTDNFIYTIGASGVGKTYLFHAMEDYSKNANEPPLSLKYPDLQTSKADKERDRKKWKAEEELEVKERHLISKVRKLCRFTFYEIADSQITEDSVTRWKSVQGYFERRLPSAIVLVFSPEKKVNIKSYSLLVNLLDKLAQDRDIQCNRNIPIYFVFNKSDILVDRLSNQSDEQMLNEFQNYLNSEKELSTDFNFFSLRYQKQAQQLGALEIANRTQLCCANLAFITQLKQDLKRVAPIIDSLLESNFTNLSFLYNCSLFQETKQYNNLKILWSDLSKFVIQATRREIEKYYQQEFKEKLHEDFRKVDICCTVAKNVTSFGFDQQVLEGINQAPTSQQLTKGFEYFKNCIEQNTQIKPVDFDSLVFKVKEADKNRFIIEKDRFSSELDTALRQILKELGIPIERKQIEKSKDSRNYQDLLIETIEFNDPKAINYYDNIWNFSLPSSNVNTFIKNQEYDVSAKIKNILYEAITDYNKEKLEDFQLKIQKDNLEIVIEQLPKQIQAIDTANRNEAFEANIREKYLYSNALTMKTALCPIQCGKFTETDRKLIKENIYPEQTVFNKLCQFTDFEEAKTYCRLLSNYLPEYPKKSRYSQFVLVKRDVFNLINVELDEIKIKVIDKLAKKLEKQQTILLEMIEILLNTRQEFEKAYKNISDEKYLDNLYSAKYFLQMLESQDLYVDNFKENPQETIKHIDNTINELIGIIYRMERSKDNTEQLDLDSIRKDCQQIILTDEWVLNKRDISKARELELKLKTASSIYKQIFKLTDRDKEGLKTLLSDDIVQRFTFQKTNNYNQNLDEL